MSGEKHGDHSNLFTLGNPFRPLGESDWSGSLRFIMVLDYLHFTSTESIEWYPALLLAVSYDLLFITSLWILFSDREK
jgi:hypothetical protein